MTAPLAPISFVIITKNEERNLPFSLRSIVGWAREVFVVDSGSTDRTAEVAAQYGATFVHHPWEGYARQKNWALSNLPITAPWVFILDADEVILPDLRQELLDVATRDDCPENGFYVNRYFVFLGKRIRHCGYYPSWNLRFFRRGKARYEERAVHEHMTVDGGAVGYLRHDMEHYDRRGLHHFFVKHNEYSTLEARVLHDTMTRTAKDERGRFFGGPIERRRWMKQQVWPKLPARWLARFLFMYVFRLGFLDGAVGFHFCFLLAGYEHQISMKLKELKLRDKEAAAEAAEAPPVPTGAPT